MTPAESKRLYLRVFSEMDEDDYASDEWGQIHEEMEQVLRAETDAAAAVPIKWWGCWDNDEAMLAAVRRVRATAKRMRLKA